MAPACPVAFPDKQHKPWVNDKLRELYLSQNNQSGAEFQEIRRSIRRKLSQLLNAYYGEKSQSLNHAAEARLVARKFKEIRNYDKLHGGRGKLMISANKQKAYFEDHFREDPDFEMPEELECPDQQEYFELDEAMEVVQGVPTVEEVRSRERSLNLRTKIRAALISVH